MISSNLTWQALMWNYLTGQADPDAYKKKGKNLTQTHTDPHRHLR